MMQCLVSDYHVVALDLPGLHSGLRTQDDRYDFPRLAACLNEFVCALELERFHLFGHSLGANVAAVFSARYQERVSSLALVSLLAVEQNSHCAHSSRFAEFRQLMQAEGLSSVESLLKMLYFRPPDIPRALLLYKMKELEAHRQFHRQVLDDMQLSMIFLLKSLQYLPENTLVVNGAEDVFLTDDSLALLRQHVANVHFKRIPNCGHLPFLEKPRELARVYQDYLAFDVNKLPCPEETESYLMGVDL